MTKYFVEQSGSHLVKIIDRNNEYIVISGHGQYGVGTILVREPHEVRLASGELNSNWANNTYPRLCRTGHSVPEDQYIVLFTSFNTGVVISAGKNWVHRVGEYSNSWIPASETGVWEACSELNIKFDKTKPKLSLLTSVNEPEPRKREFPLFALGYIPSAPKQTFVVMFTDETSGTVVQSPEPLGTNYGPLTQLKNLKLSNFTVLPLGTTITLSLG